MKEYLLVYDVKLTVRAPLFVGSGRSYSKKEYVYDSKSHEVRIMDEDKMLDALVRDRLIDAYEHYTLRRPYAQMGEFLKECGFSPEETEAMTLYRASAADALVPGKTLAEIWQFTRDVRHDPYVPGSSLKGALRTAILMKMISQGEKIHLDPDSRRGSRQDIEPAYLNSLGFKNARKTDETNSVMRGVSVSDSLPISQNDIILARKDDISVGGLKNSINTIREAVRPGVAISFRLTLDSSVKSAVNADFIRDAVAEYGEYYFKTYASSFRLPDNAKKDERFTDCIVLGGGGGYFGKNIVYPMLGKEAGLEYVTNIMKNKFRNHRHEDDVEKGISPHCLKHTTYNGLSYHFGVCGFSMEQA